jgi:hypothetical protein
VAYRVLRNGLWQLAVGEVTHGVYQNEVVLGRCFGNNPIVVDHEGHVAWQDDVAGCVYLWRIGTAPMGVITRREIRPTGLSRIDPLLGVRFIDEDRVLVPGMFNPVWAGACVVGEGQTGLVAQIGAVRGDVLPGECMVPRVAVRGDTYAAVTWGSPGCAWPGSRQRIFRPHPWWSFHSSTSRSGWACSRLARHENLPHSQEIAVC